MTVKASEKIFRAKAAEQAGEERDLIGSNIVQLYTNNGLGIVAHQQRAAFGHTPPIALFACGNLKVVKLDGHSAVEQIDAVHLVSSVGKRETGVGGCDCLLNRWQISGHCGRVLI